MPPPPAPVRKEQNGGANDAVQSSLTAASVLEACSAELMKLEKVVAQDLLTAKSHDFLKHQASLASFTKGATAYKSTVGVMLTGVMIDNVLIGGPAFISGKLSKGDVVLSVDGKEATIENVHDLLVGSDIPGADLHMRVMKNDSGKEVEVVLQRMATAKIADKRHLFELFTKLKDRHLREKNREMAKMVDEVLALWTKMVATDMAHDVEIENNLKGLQTFSAQHLSELERLLALLSPGELSVRSGPELEAENARLRKQVEELQRQLEARGAMEDDDCSWI